MSEPVKLVNNQEQFMWDQLVVTYTATSHCRSAELAAGWADGIIAERRKREFVGDTAGRPPMLVSESAAEMLGPENAADGRKVIMVEMDSAALAAVWKTAHLAVLEVGKGDSDFRNVAPGTGDGLMELAEEFKRHGLDPRTHSHITKIT